MTFLINVIRHDLISSQCVSVVALLYTRSWGALCEAAGRCSTVELNGMHFEQLNACAAECSSVSLWIINIYLSHILFMCYFIYPSVASYYHGPGGPTCLCVNLAQSSLAEHILFSNYPPTALCSPHHDQFRNPVFKQYISNANSLLSTVLIMLGTVDGCVHLLTASMYNHRL